MRSLKQKSNSYNELLHIYKKSIVKNAEQQLYIDDLERTCHYYKTVDKSERQHIGIV